MKKSQLTSAIKNILAENKKQKLEENTIRQMIREVLSERDQDITVSFTSAEVSAILDALASSNIENNVSKAGDMQGAGGNILANLAQATAKLKNAYYPNPQADLNEEAYDTIRDIINNHGNRPSEAEVRANLTGNDDDEVLKHFGYGSGTVIGYQYGRPIYANQKKKVTNWKYSGGGYGRKRYE